MSCLRLFKIYLLAGSTALFLLSNAFAVDSDLDRDDSLGENTYLTSVVDRSDETTDIHNRLDPDSRRANSSDETIERPAQRCADYLIQTLPGLILSSGLDIGRSVATAYTSFLVDEGIDCPVEIAKDPACSLCNDTARGACQSFGRPADFCDSVANAVCPDECIASKRCDDIRRMADSARDDLAAVLQEIIRSQNRVDMINQIIEYIDLFPSENPEPAVYPAKSRAEYIQERAEIEARLLDELPKQEAEARRIFALIKQEYRDYGCELDGSVYL